MCVTCFMAQHLDEPVDVVVLDRLEVKAHGLGHARVGLALGAWLYDRDPGALQGAVDRDRARAEQACALARREAEPVAQQQRRALAGRQALMRGGERLGERVVAVGGAVALVGRLLVAGDRPALAPVDLVEAGVGRDRMKPRAQRGAGLEAPERPPGAQHHLLKGVLGVVVGAQDATTVGVELAAVRLEQGREGIAVAAARGLDQLGLAHLSDGRRRVHVRSSSVFGCRIAGLRRACVLSPVIPI